jgi:hypothetical protein
MEREEIKGTRGYGQHKIQRPTLTIQRPTSNAENRTVNSVSYRMRTPLAAVSFAFCRYWALSVGRWTLDVDCVRHSLLRSWLSAIAFFMIASTATAQVDESPYFGDWENDRGDTLQITSESIKVNNEKPVRYDDITEDSDETFFVLQIKDSSELSYFGGNFLRITFGKDPDHFTMSIYKTLPDTLKKENEVKRIEWSAPAVEKEETDETGQPKEEQKKDEEKKSDQPKDDQGPEKATPSPTATSSPRVP